LAEDRVALIRKIKEANDIVEVVGQYVALRPVGQTYKGLCPFHDDHHPSFDVDPRRQRYRCWACGKFGDVISFLQEQERLTFWEAVEMLARRAGISLEKVASAAPVSPRAAMLEVIRWAAAEYHRCLLDDPVAEAARHYLAQRQLQAQTVQRFGLGYAPLAGDWLVRRAEAAHQPLELLEQVGLIARRTPGVGYYDRFRDRLLFPIRDVRGRPVAFSGRILPTSPLAERGPKYYNSPASPVFNKGELLYGLDQARAAAAQAGYLAVVEGYTDVLMAHQLGVEQVVATMGTALTAAHVQQLRRLVPQVVLVFDADAGGLTGVDRALELFVRCEVDLRIATLPAGMDPCDFLLAHGAEAFRSTLTAAPDVLEFKLNQVWVETQTASVENQRRAADAVLTILAQAPEPAPPALALKRELMMTRLAQRLKVPEELLRARLRELRRQRPATPPHGEERTAPTPRLVPAAPHEKQLLQVLLAEPALVPLAAAQLPSAEVTHPGLRLLLEGLYRLQAEGVEPSLDHLRLRLDHPLLLAKALELQEQGRAIPDRRACLLGVLARFAERRTRQQTQQLRQQLQAADDHHTALELLRQLQKRAGG
jgi:DNA primase